MFSAQPPPCINFVRAKFFMAIRKFAGSATHLFCCTSCKNNITRTRYNYNKPLSSRELVFLKLRELRQAKGLTQTQLAHKIGMASSCVSAVEGGARQPWPNFRRKVAKALGVSEEEIFANG